MSGDAETSGWLTGQKRSAVHQALMMAALPPEVAPEGYADLRGQLWVKLAADRTVPAKRLFEAHVGSLFELLTVALNERDAGDQTASLERALLWVGRAWQASGCASEWGA